MRLAAGTSAPDVLPLPRRVGRYELRKRIAIGGMAEIYEAAAHGVAGFARRVAIKRILPGHADNPAFVSMFLDEARLGAQLRHPCIAQVLDLGVDDDGAVFYAMEYLEGLDVRQLRRALRDRGEVMPLPCALAIGIAAAAALHAAHDARDGDGALLGVVHRDVTPANLMVTVDGQVKLLDFGIAHHARRETRTEAGVLKGKASYMSPEQILCRPLDRRSDVFSLGVVLYELTTGTRLFDGCSEFETMRQIALESVPRPSTRRADYPAELEAIVLRALAPSPADRHPTAEALRVELEAFAASIGARRGEAALAELVAALGGPSLERSPEPTPRAPDEPTRLSPEPPVHDVWPDGEATLPTAVSPAF